MKILFIFLLLAACSGPRPLTAQEISEATEFCRLHHRQAIAYETNGPHPRVVAIQCAPQDSR